MNIIQKIGIWLPVIGLFFLWWNAVKDKTEKLIGARIYALACLLQISYILIVLLILDSLHFFKC